jgi:quinol monooxygenase YgiN
MKGENMPENSFRAVARLKAKPDKVDELQELLRGLVGPTRKEEGCLSYELMQNRADPTDFTFVEEWASDAALDAHFATEHIQNALSKVPDLCAEEPDIRTYTVIG